MAEADHAGGKLRVFISYSRVNVDWADQLVELLEDRGFDAILDRHDITPGEPWEERLSNLIFEADKVVFVLTETSAASEICRWEAAKAVELGKPIIPVTIGPMGGVNVPAELAALNYIYFYADPNKPGSGPFAGAKELDSWLRTDLAWTRERTRLIARARQHNENPVDALLMRGEELAEARDWASRKPDDANVPASITTYIEASDAAEAALKAQADADIAAREEALAKAEEEQKRRRRDTRRVLIAALVIGIVGAATTIFAARFALEAERTVSLSLSDLARQQANENRHGQAILMSLIADPKAETGLTGIYNRFFGDTENQSAQTALMSSLISNPIESVFESGMYVTGVEANPVRENILVTVHEEFDVHVWDRNNPGDEPVVLRHNTYVRAADWHPDGNRLITAGDDGVARLWDTTTGQILTEYDGHTDWIRDIAFFEGGNRFVTASDDSTLKVWSIGSTEPLREFQVQEDEWPYALAVSPDGQYLLTGTDFGLAYLWDLEGDGVPLQVFENQQYGVYSAVTFDTASQRVALGADIGTIDVWWIGDDTPTYQFNYHSDGIRSLAYLDDGVTLVAGSMDGRVTFWNVEFPSNVPNRVLNHPDMVSAAELSTDGTQLTSATFGGHIRTYGLPSAGANISETGITSLSIHPDGRRFITADFDGSAKLYRRGTSEPDRRFSMLSDAGGPQKSVAGENDSSITTALFHPDGERILTGHYDGVVRVWHLDGFGVSETYQVYPNDRPVVSLAFTAAGDGFVSGSTNGEVHVWRFGASEREHAFAGSNTASEMSENSVLSVAAHPDGQRYVAGYVDQAVRLWQAGQEAPVAELDAHFDWVQDAQFLPDGSGFISVSDDSQAYLWDFEGTEPIRGYSGHFGWIQALDIHPDGKQFVTSADDGTVRLWSIDRESALQVFDADGENVVDVAFSPDGRDILAVSTSGNLRVFERSDILDQNLDEQMNYACVTLLDLGVPYFTPADATRIPGIRGRSESELDPCRHRELFAGPELTVVSDPYDPEFLANAIPGQAYTDEFGDDFMIDEDGLVIYFDDEEW